MTTDLVRLPWVGHRSRRWEPEPLRWLGVNVGASAAAGRRRRGPDGAVTGAAGAGRLDAARSAPLTGRLNGRGSAGIVVRDVGAYSQASKNVVRSRPVTSARPGR